MAKKVTALVKLQVKAGMANPSPPVGPVKASTPVLNLWKKACQFQ